MANNTDFVNDRSILSTSSSTESTIASISQRIAKQKVLSTDYHKFLTELTKRSSVERLKLEIEAAKDNIEKRKQLEIKLQKEIERVENDAYKASAVAYKNAWARATNSRRIEMSKQLADEEAENRKLAQKEYETNKAFVDQRFKDGLISAIEHYDQVNKLEQDRNKYVKESIQAESEERTKASKLEMSQQQKFIKGVESKAKAAQNRADTAQKHLQDLQKEYHEMEDSELFSSDEMEAKRQQLLSARNDANLAQFKANVTQAISEGLSNAVGALANGVTNSFHEVESMMTDYKGVIGSRLQGSGKTFTSILDLTVGNTAASPFVKTQEVLKAVKTASDQGIAYNIEQRAFLSTISDKIASTFDAFDSNLSRLIRLQQADTTAARLGMEASLTKFFNEMFQDTSYLTDLSKSVSAAIIDANSQLDRDNSAAFEYVVQKWLGSLSALGMSSNAVSSIAEGINYLATGNVSALASNNSLQTLFAMSASKAGLNYSDLLLQGMNATNTNKLLESMVRYLKEIADNSDNQVVKGAYGNIFNMSMSDFKSIQNLSSGDISNISNSMLTYSNMMSELNNQFSQLTARTSVSEMISNISSNAMFGLGKEMYENPGVYAMMKMLDVMDTLGVKINIPAISVMGTGIDLNTDVNSLMRLALGASQSFSLLTTILGSIGAGGGLNLGAWNGTEYTQRGTGRSSLNTLLGGTSSSTYVATGNAKDMKKSALSTATDDAEESGKITNKNHKTEHDFDEFYTAVVGSNAKSFLAVREAYLSRAYDESNNWIRVFDSSVSTQLRTIFGASSFYDRRLKVSDSSIDKYASGSAIKVVDSGLNEVVSALMAVKSATQSQASLKAAAPTVAIDEESVKRAILNAITSTANTNSSSLQEVIDLLSQGKLIVQSVPTLANPLVNVNVKSIEQGVINNIKR